MSPFRSGYLLLTLTFICVLVTLAQHDANNISMGGQGSIDASQLPKLDIDFGHFDTLQTLDISFMLRGYCYAHSSIEDTNAAGGFAPSGNRARRNRPNMNTGQDGPLLIVKSSGKTSFQRHYRGTSLFLINPSKTALEFSAQDSRLNIVQEALDSNGQWRFIEYLPRSWCGNSYHRVSLPAQHYWHFAAARYTGKLQTRLRFRLLIDDSDSTKSIYSNEFSGYVNPEQFTRIQPYYTGSLMNPVDDIPADETGPWGLVDTNGTILQDAVFDEIGMYADGLRPVRNNGKWGYASSDGTLRVAARFDLAREFVDGRAAVNIGARLQLDGEIGGGHWSFITPEGDLICDPQFYSVEDFSKGLAIVRGKARGQVGAINAQGRLILPQRYDDVRFSGHSKFMRISRKNILGYQRQDSDTIQSRQFSESYWLLPEVGLLSARSKGVIHLYFSDGRQLLFDSVDAIRRPESYADDRAFSSYKNLYGIIDSDGEFRVLSQKDSVLKLVQAPAVVGRDRYSLRINAKVKQDASGYFDSGFFTSRRAALPWLDLTGSLDNFARETITTRFLDIDRLHEQLIVLNDGRFLGLALPDGSIIAEPRFDRISRYKKFSEGLIAVAIDGKWGYIDSLGRQVIACQFDAAEPFRNGRAVVMVDGRYGIINRRGEIIGRTNYHKIGWFGGGSAPFVIRE